MTAAGWFIMVAAVGGTTVFLTWCIWKVIATPGSEGNVRSQVDMDLPDRGT